MASFTPADSAGDSSHPHVETWSIHTSHQHSQVLPFDTPLSPSNSRPHCIVPFEGPAPTFSSAAALFSEARPSDTPSFNSIPISGPCPSQNNRSSILTAHQFKRQSLQAQPQEQQQSRSSTAFKRTSSLFTNPFTSSAQPTVQTPKQKRLSHLENVPVSSRLKWSLDLTFAPAVHRVSYQIVQPKRVIIQKQIDRPRATSRPPTRDSQSEVLNKPFAEKTLVWGDSEADLVTADPQADLADLKAPDFDFSAFDFDPNAIGIATTKNRESDYDADNDWAHSQADSDELDDMGLARAFTQRFRRESKDVSSTSRPQISLPVNLISSTNMASFNAPDIAQLNIKTNSQSINSEVSSPSSRRTTFSSPRSSSEGTVDSEPTLTDASSISSDSPITPNHLTKFFEHGNAGSAKLNFDPDVSNFSMKELPKEPEVVQERHDIFVEAPPMIPKRAPSHSKREHERLARVRSVRSSASSGMSRYRTSVSNDLGVDETDPAILEKHPFSSELEQLNEVAEEFSSVVHHAEAAEDAQVIAARGFFKGDVSDYLCELSGPFAPIPEEPLVPAALVGGTSTAVWV